MGKRNKKHKKLSVQKKPSLDKEQKKVKLTDQEKQLYKEAFRELYEMKKQKNASVGVRSGTSYKETSIFKQAFYEHNDYRNVFHLLDYFAVHDPDFSHAVSNIMNLANTDFSFYFHESVPKSKSKRMLSDLQLWKESIRKNSGGVRMMINDFLVQLITKGAIGGEAKVSKRILDGVDDIIKADLFTIYAQRIDGEIRYFQLIDGQYNPLNPNTFFYIPMFKIKTVYGVPPLLSAFGPIDIDFSLTESFRTLAKKLGMFGVLQVLFTELEPEGDETDQQYIDRSMKFLDQQAAWVDNSLQKGFILGFKDQHEVSLQGSHLNATGAKTITEMNDVKKMSGLKQSPDLLGRSYSYTETFGRILLQLLKSQATTFQTALASAFTFVASVHLKLKGHEQKYIDLLLCEFKAPAIHDRYREAQARNLEIANAWMLFEKGFLSLDAAAQEIDIAKAEKTDEEMWKKVGSKTTNKPVETDPIETDEGESGRTEPN